MVDVTHTGRNTTDAVTNKDITDASNDVAAKQLHTATGTVAVDAATAPTNGQVLTATSSTTADWQDAAGSAKVSYGLDPATATLPGNGAAQKSPRFGAFLTATQLEYPPNQDTAAWFALHAPESPSAEMTVTIYYLMGDAGGDITMQVSPRPAPDGVLWDASGADAPFTVSAPANAFETNTLEFNFTPGTGTFTAGEWLHLGIGRLGISDTAPGVVQVIGVKVTFSPTA